ncbi:MAG: DUF4184 family protein [Segetibacter sp.]
MGRNFLVRFTSVFVTLVYLFNSLIKKEFIEHLPQFLNKRFSQFESSERNLNSLRDFIVITISLIIGITSHIIWDKLTHKTVRFIDEQEHYTVFGKQTAWPELQ